MKYGNLVGEGVRLKHFAKSADFWGIMSGCKIGKIRMKSGGAEIQVISGRANTPVNEVLSRGMLYAKDHGYDEVAIILRNENGGYTTSFHLASDDSTPLLGVLDVLKDRLLLHENRRN